MRRLKPTIEEYPPVSASATGGLPRFAKHSEVRAGSAIRLDRSSRPTRQYLRHFVAGTLHPVRLRDQVLRLQLRSSSPAYRLSTGKDSSASSTAASGLPASRIITGEHRLELTINVAMVTEFHGEAGEIWSIVLESFTLDVPDGNNGGGQQRLISRTLPRLATPLLEGQLSRSRPLETFMSDVNGEIYNHEELRKGLPGHNFRTGSDCDVIAHLYEEHGENFGDMLDGIFSFVLLDTRDNNFIVARDAIAHEQEGV
ncbi:hypothetical protein J5N97_026003 [Dioscorea zingiberensis]|uniref:Glutamine amidotransferase type-2 domain-containing protein n=1 Tax=Dioscorea zingiberensis TaxID=325984 RepID=A0A9D5C1L6_9LILI|nr:hypothetical protein J5N97_026003 [Dioscorea zingiberensis]